MLVRDYANLNVVCCEPDAPIAEVAALMRRRARMKAKGEEGAWVVDGPRIDDVLGALREQQPKGDDEDGERG